MYKKDHERRKPRKIIDIQAGNRAEIGVNISYSDTRMSNNEFDK